MANTKDFKVKNGIEPTAYHEAVGSSATSETVYYDLANAEMLVETLDLNNAHGNIDRIDSLLFTPDGTKLVVGAKDTLSASQPRTYLYEFNLDTAWDISTITDSSAGDQLTNETTVGVYGLAWNSDGTKFFVSGGSGDIFEYTTSTAYSVDNTDVTYAGNSEALDAQTETGTGSRGILFHDGGDKLIVATRSGHLLVEYSMTSPYDISTATHNQTKDVSADITNPENIAFNDDGSVLYILDGSGNVHTCSLTTNYDISTLSVGSSTAFSAGSMFLKPNGNKLYCSTSSKTVQEYDITSNKQTLDMSTGSVFEVTLSHRNDKLVLSNPADSGTVSSASVIINRDNSNVDKSLTYGSYDDVFFDVEDQTASTTIHCLVFNDDGTKMYVGPASGTSNILFEYGLTTAYDISTAYYTNTSFTASQVTGNLRKALFNADGSKLYLLDSGTDTAYQYSLSTNYAISTATYDSVSLDISTYETNPTGIAFNDTGSKFYVTGVTGDNITEYDLSTNYSLASVTYNQETTSFNSLDTGIRGFVFANNGKHVYLIGGEQAKIFQFYLTTAYDISTLVTANSNSFDFRIDLDVSSESSNPWSIALNDDESKLFLTGYPAGSNGYGVFQYSLTPDRTLSFDSSIEFEDGAAPALVGDNETDLIVFSTRDGGTSYQAAQAVDGAK